MSLIRRYEMRSGDFMSHILHDPEEGFVILSDLSEDLIDEVLSHLLFVLPIRPSVTFIPNPHKRFCLNLMSEINWFRSKKMRKYVSQFRISITKTKKEELEEAAVYHKDEVAEDGSESWMTDELIAHFHAISSSSRSNVSQPTTAPVELCTFSLIEVESGIVTARTFGFLCGCVYHDYTMSTPVRDHRSCGSILTKLVGFILQQRGVNIWYWGYLVPYMKDYVEHYGGCEMDRVTFYQKWTSTKNQPLQKSYCDIVLPHDIQITTEL